MKKMINIAVIGLGNVGAYLLNELNKKKKEIENKTGKKINIAAISAKNINKKANPLVIRTNNLSAPCPPNAVFIALPPIAVPIPPVLLLCNNIIPINSIRVK